ncbi:MAG TPA: SusC/RagA family TonB-linked outer membrane protein, partial [Chitinophagaceae bacterium]
MMKMTILLICAFSLQSIANDGFAQEKITLRLENASLRKAFKTIEKQSSFRFVYNEQLLPADRKITISVRAMPLEHVMEQLLENTALTFKIIGVDLVVIAANQRDDPGPNSTPAPAAIAITGKVLNNDNKPLANISILEKGTTNGTVTRGDGSFSLNVADANATLVISSVGFVSQEIALNGRKNINVTLRETTEELNTVVVVGYGTQRKKDLTGAVGSVPMANTEKTPVFGTSQLLQGTVSGVQVTQTNSQPGASFTVRVRGTNSISSSSDPLYVIDGYAGADINALNPNDIASIEVLKDASATAIYGSRGANGVILITTKKGTPGRNAVSFDMYTGVQQVGKTFDMMNAKQFATYLNQVTAADAPTMALPFTQAQIDALGEGTNWQKDLFRSAPISNYSLGFSGGNADSRYYLSFNYFTQKGIVLNSDYKRGTVRFNLDNKVSDKVRIGINTQVSYDFQDLANVNTNGGSSGGTILDALRASPTIPLYDSTGAYSFQNGPSGYTDILGNPVAAAVLNSDKGATSRIFANAFGEYEIIKGLKFRTSFGGELYNRREDVFRPSTTYLGKTTGGYAGVNTNNNYDWLNENTFTYDRQFGGIHAINVVAGWTYQSWQDRSANTTATTLSSNSYGTDNLGVGASITSSSNTTVHVLASGLGRINYRLMDKYLFTFTMRADGSSRFGANKKWGYFPSGAVAWRMSDEKFIKSINAISDLKIRASYGVTGNQEIGSYNSLTQYGTNSYGLNGTRVVGISPNNIANADLGWESTASFDIGLDLGLLKNRVTFNADYYNKKTTNLLYNVTLPSTSGFTTMLQNIGSVQNQGVELSLTTVNIEHNKLRWTTSFNIARNFNKVL